MPVNFKKIIRDHPVLTGALAITLLLYARVLFFGHISWDDPEMVFRNKAVRDFDLRALFTEHFVGMYIPLTMLLHALGWFFFENNAGGHHALNIMLHLVNGMLVYRVALRLLPGNKTASLTAVVFLLHPLQLESVAWISELKNTLSATFFFAAVLSYLRFYDTRRQANYLYCLLFFVAGCLSKSSVVILPLILVCIDIFRERKFSLKGIINKIPFFLIAVVFGLVNLKTQAADQFINYSHAFAYHVRLGYAGFALLRYLTLFLFPYNLSVLYPYPENEVLSLGAGFFFLLLITIYFTWLEKKKERELIALMLMCITSLVLVLQFVPFGEVLYADRYMYIPLVFFSMFLFYLASRTRLNMTLLTYFVAVALALVTFFRMDVWKNSALLYADILKKYPNSFVALNSLGADLMLQNHDREALHYLNRSVDVSPYNYKGYYNRGLLYLKNGKPGEAIDDFNEAIKLFDYHKAYIGRASAYYMTGDIPKAMKDAAHVLEKQPRHAKALFILADCYNNLNQLDSAIALYSKSIRLADDDADFYFKRAIAYGKKQEFRNSLQDLDVCIRLKPDYYQAYYWRGVAKIRLSQDPCGDFRVAGSKNIEPAVQAFNKYCR